MSERDSMVEMLTKVVDDAVREKNDDIRKLEQHCLDTLELSRRKVEQEMREFRAKTELVIKTSIRLQAMAMLCTRMQPSDAKSMLDNIEKLLAED